MGKTVVILMVITLLSKVVGFAREITLSYFYGASYVSDAYFISITIHDVIFSFLGIGITTGFIPMITKIEKKMGILESDKFTNNLINILLIVCTIIVLIVEIFTEQIVGIFALGFKGETFILANKFTKIIIIGVYFSIVIAILNSYLQIKNKFILPAVLGFIYSISIIISVYVSSIYNYIFLSIGNALALFLQLVFLLFFVRKTDLKYRFFIDFKDKHIIEIGKISLPLFFGVTISQLNVIVDKTIASQLAVGGISSLNYADRINSFILSTVVMSIITVIFPKLSKTFTNNQTHDFKKLISKSISVISLLIVPTAIITSIFAAPIVNLLFGRGAFNSQAISMTSSVLFFYSIGMIGIGFREVLSRAFFSMQDTKTPMINATVGLFLNVVFSIILSKYLGLGGIAFATSISAAITTVMMFISLRKRIGPFGMKKMFISFLKIIFASIVMGFFVFISLKYLMVYFHNQNIALIICSGIGVLIYIVIINSLGIEVVEELKKLFERRFSKLTK